MKQKEMRVDVLLKESQGTINNLWEFTHHEEVKLITGRTVQYYVENREAAMNSFNWNEVDEVYFDGIQILMEAGVYSSLSYIDILVDVLVDTNTALHYGNSLENGFKVYGEQKISYQSIIDLLTPIMKEMKKCVMMLEILKKKKDLTV